ncbi:MAG TPA: ABC transporter permease [Sphingomicrobium sp.]|nr:ABC transporter permease [Sphingomicrobium sp.]
MSPVRAYCTQVHAVTAAEVLKLVHDPMDLFSRAVQPILWLLLFGQVMARVRGLGTGSYLDFLAAGVLAQSVLFVSIFYGLSAIWERDLGSLHRYLVSPAPRSALVLGKAIASSVRAMSQGAVVYGCSALLGVKLSFLPLSLLGVASLIFIASALFSTFSLIIACIVRTRERFMGIGQFLTMPIFFASNAVYPIELMPRWLQVIAHVNPLTFLVDGLRGLMLANGRPHFPFVMDFGVPLVLFALFLVIASRLFSRLAE